MIQSKAATVEEYLAELDPERRRAIGAVSDVILANLPDGYLEAMNWGMISYEIPLERCPDTYPLSYAALASQKQYMSLYLNAVYADPHIEAWFTGHFKASGKKLNMGKSCVRFRQLDDLPLDLIGETIARVSVDQYNARYEASRR